MFKFSLSVRAYNTARKFGLPHFEDWNRLPSEAMQAACLKAADNIRGKKTAVELYRAGGLGVYQIAQIMHSEDVSIDCIRALCERFDKMLHEGLE